MPGSSLVYAFLQTERVVITNMTTVYLVCVQPYECVAISGLCIDDNITFYLCTVEFDQHAVGNIP